MEWTNDLVIALVTAYRDHPDLWDPSAPYSKVKARRDRSWEEIAEKFGTDVNEVKKKMNSALASFRRERSKVLKSGNDYEEAYESKWFAFDSFRFLMDRTAPTRQHDDIMEPLIESTYNVQEFDCATVIKSELEDQQEDLDLVYSSINDETFTNRDQTIGKAPGKEDSTFIYRNRKAPKRKYQYDDPRVNTLCKIARKLTNEYEKRDECKVFGEYLMYKLRNYDFRTRSVVQHLINNIVFNADMGKYAKSDAKPNTEQNTNKRGASDVAVLQEKILTHDIDYLQEINNIVSEGKHFLDV